MILTRILCLIIGYAFGIISPAYFYAKAKGYNIKKIGSGNAGTTNIFRAFGNGAGILVFACDFLKALIACVICLLIFGDISNLYSFEFNKIVLSYASLGLILGHCFPFYLKFNGGKGVVCALASMLLLDWMGSIFALLVFFIVLIAFRYVSLSSIMAAFTFFLFYWLFNTTGSLAYIDTVNSTSFGDESVVIVFIIVVIIIVRHRGNIKRIIKRDERKIHFHKNKRHHHHHNHHQSHSDSTVDNNK